MSECGGNAIRCQFFEREGVVVRSLVVVRTLCADVLTQNYLCMSVTGTLA